MSRARTILSFLIAPAIVPTLVLVHDLSTGTPLYRQVSFGENFFFAYATATIVGIPTYLFLHSIGALRPWVILTVAAYISSAPRFLLPHMPIMIDLSAGWTHILAAAALFSAEGIVTGAVFWLFIRPNLRAPVGLTSFNRRPLDTASAILLAFWIPVLSMVAITGTIALVLIEASVVR